jgi:ATP-dependent DNA ligase
LPSFRADRLPSGRDWIHEIKLDGFRMMVRLGFEGIVSKRLGSAYRSGRSRDWLKMKNPSAPEVKREAEEEWGRDRWR